MKVIRNAFLDDLDEQIKELENKIREDLIRIEKKIELLEKEIDNEVRN